MSKMLFPPGLKPGDTIGIVAPSAPCETEIAPAIAELEAAGYRLCPGHSVHNADGFLAGDDKSRAADLAEMFLREDIKAILCLRGGYGAARILPLLPFAQIRKNPKLFIGYSDITALHIALQEKAGLATVHGPMLTSLLPSRRPTAYTRAALLRGLSEPFRKGRFPQAKGHKLSALAAGKARGRLAGGNLTVLASLIGTPYELKGDGCLLFLEDVGEAAYRIDRMLNQLTQSGLIRRVSGIILGDFTRCGPTQPEPYDFSVNEVLTVYAGRWQKPLISGLSAGHGRQNGWLPLGAEAEIDTDTNTLTFI